MITSFCVVFFQLWKPPLNIPHQQPNLLDTCALGTDSRVLRSGAAALNPVRALNGLSHHSHLMGWQRLYIGLLR